MPRHSTEFVCCSREGGEGQKGGTKRERSQPQPSTGGTDPMQNWVPPPPHPLCQGVAEEEAQGWEPGDGQVPQARHALPGQLLQVLQEEEEEGESSAASSRATRAAAALGSYLIQHQDDGTARLPRAVFLLVQSLLQEEPGSAGLSWAQPHGQGLHISRAEEGSGVQHHLQQGTGVRGDGSPPPTPIPNPESSAP